MPRPESREPAYGGLDPVLVDLPQDRPEFGVGSLRGETFAGASYFRFFGAGWDLGAGG
ncbi:hypothetical protein [Amycolatopsis sp. WAC 01416]|uniref:hypothetical protein n=1 Tax=Amycolatopsis sp. WAC 01416 TaxID=2203196 RepID=UPI001F3492D6|nr:hypothetical protein [Amycolatopsis sp. WAC 01416]